MTVKSDGYSTAVTAGAPQWLEDDIAVQWLVSDYSSAPQWLEDDIAVQWLVSDYYGYYGRSRTARAQQHDPTRSARRSLTLLVRHDTTQVIVVVVATLYSRYLY